MNEELIEKVAEKTYSRWRSLVPDMPPWHKIDNYKAKEVWLEDAGELIILISAEERKQERERIVEYLGNDRGFGLVKKVQALKEGGKEAE